MTVHLLPHISKETQQAPDASIIWLHGLGADGHDFEPMVQQLALPDDMAIRFIFPHAPSMPVSINDGYIMPAWYDIQQQDIQIEQDQHGIQQSASAIQLLIDREIMRGIAPHRIILAGFSQGAAIALYVGLRQKDALAGIIALSGYILAPNAIIPATCAKPSDIFLGHGIHDNIVPIKLGKHAQQFLQHHQCLVHAHHYPMEHSVCPEEVRDIRQWIIAQLAE